MAKMLGMALMFLGATTALMAVGVPEIDPATGGSALALVAGALLVMRGRRK
jgi:hypothetical protein